MVIFKDDFNMLMDAVGRLRYKQEMLEDVMQYIASLPDDKSYLAIDTAKRSVMISSGTGATA